MSFLTQNVNDTPAQQYRRALQIASQLRAQAVVYRDQAQAGSVRAMDLDTGLLFVLVESRIELQRARNAPGIVDYAKAQQDDPAYNIALEFTAMIAELDTTLAWMEANFPQDGTGHIITKTFVGDGSGQVQSDTITDPTALTALTTRLNALIATID